jgi:hypothetical protein
MDEGSGRERNELLWDEAGRLVEVRTSYGGGAVSARQVYVWRDDELERIRHFDDSGDDVFADPPEHERVWRWSGGRPIGIRTVSRFGPPGIPFDEWEWEADGRTVRITESNDVRVLNRRTVTYDAAGRLVHVEGDLDADGTIDRVLDVEWSPEGRILSAREQRGPDLATVRIVTFRWDDRGRLLGQTNDLNPGKDLWIYRYPEDP